MDELQSKGQAIRDDLLSKSRAALGETLTGEDRTFHEERTERLTLDKSERLAYFAS